MGNGGSNVGYPSSQSSSATTTTTNHLRRPTASTSIDPSSAASHHVVYQHPPSFTYESCVDTDRHSMMMMTSTSTDPVGSAPPNKGSEYITSSVGSDLSSHTYGKRDDVDRPTSRYGMSYPFRSCLSGRKRRPSDSADFTLPVMNARELRRKLCPQDASDRDLEYHRLCVNSSRNILSHMAQNTLSKFVFASDLPTGTHTFVVKPSDVHVDESKEFLIRTADDQLLHAYWLPTSSPNSKYAILYLHGASGNIGHRLEVAKIIQKGLNADVLLIDYRGFGRSTGQPSELGTYLDAQAGLDWMIGGCTDGSRYERCNEKKIVVFGTSLGAAITMHLVSQEDNARHIHAAIVENSFTSVCEISRYYIPNWARPFLDFLKSTSMCPMFDCLSKANRIRCPILYLVGLKDHVVPSWMTQVLYSQTNNSSRKCLREFLDGRHNDLPNFSNYPSVILDFLNNDERFPTCGYGRDCMDGVELPQSENQSPASLGNGMNLASSKVPTASTSSSGMSAASSISESESDKLSMSCVDYVVNVDDAQTVSPTTASSSIPCPCDIGSGA